MKKALLFLFVCMPLCSWAMELNQSSRKRKLFAIEAEGHIETKAEETEAEALERLSGESNAVLYQKQLKAYQNFLKARENINKNKRLMRLTSLHSKRGRYAIDTTFHQNYLKRFAKEVERYRSARHIKKRREFAQKTPKGLTHCLQSFEIDGNSRKWKRM